MPLFDDNGREIPTRTIRACIDAGWAEPWFSNPIKPDWLVCKLTPAAIDALSASEIRKKLTANQVVKNFNNLEKWRICKEFF
ncbi:hypothetical protein QW131_14055 [Roseibium salinum]|nr:hypothetical protein [Roseibium salinum]